MCLGSSTETVKEDDPVRQSSSSLWEIHGELYDLTEFVDLHPGGRTSILLAQGTDATELFEQFHLLNDNHRKLLKRLKPLRQGLPNPKAQSSSAFHDDLREMVQDHFKGQKRGAHKSKREHTIVMLVMLALYAGCFLRWFAGDLVYGGLALPLLAWFVMANMAHDGSHHACSMKPWVNELWLLSSSPLLYSYASWYMQHCVSHHRHTNDIDHDVDISHHPFARWHRLTKLDSKYMSGLINMIWHVTAWLLSTINMSLVHPWKFVVVPLWYTRVLRQELPPIFGRDNEAYIADLRAQGVTGDLPHELMFFRVAGDLHRNGFFDSPWRTAAALATWLAGIFFTVSPFFRFSAGRAVGLTLLPYAITSLIFFAVTQISHVQVPCQRDPPSTDFFKRQAETSMDYACGSELWRFLTGGLNVQSIHHVMPGVHSSHYADLYPKFYAVCAKHGCAPANLPSFLDALKAHLGHIIDLGRLGPSTELKKKIR